jgi:hypothetical protein
MNNSHLSFQLKEKHDFVCSVDALIKNGHSLVVACHCLGIPTVYYHRWRKVMETVGDLDEEDRFIPFNKSGNTRRIHPGCRSFLAPVKAQLTAFIMTLRNQGIQCMNRMVMREKARILPAFQEKTISSREQIIRRFTKSIDLIHHAATHLAPKHF